MPPPVGNCRGRQRAGEGQQRAGTDPEMASRAGKGRGLEKVNYLLRKYYFSFGHIIVSQKVSYLLRQICFVFPHKETYVFAPEQIRINHTYARRKLVCRGRCPANALVIR